MPFSTSAGCVGRGGRVAGGMVVSSHCLAKGVFMLLAVPATGMLSSLPKAVALLAVAARLAALVLTTLSLEKADAWPYGLLVILID